MSGRLMGMWFKLMAKLALLLAPVFMAGGALWFWLAQESLLFKPEALPAGTALSTASDVFEVSVPVPGASLSALHLKLNNPKGLVFFLHGNSGNLQSWFVNTDLYRKAGYDLFMLDYRGYGKSTGHIESEAQLRSDVRTAFEQVSAQYAGKKIVIYGRSLGSGLAAGLSAELGARPGPVQPDLTVLVSPYSSMLAMANDHYPLIPSGLIRYPLRTDALVGQIRSPLLLFHGDQDRLISPLHSASLNALAPKAELVVVAGAAHNDLHTFAAYREKFVAALEGL